ncbi:MAG TPA: ImmA/IrrE family metallo-endopeptidase [Patescibacteria group bacterium]|nr:ImmA/IrrE family metallo-endopeptidase [Patescibacteria group bacterium]
MAKPERLTGTPDYASPPGRILEKTLAGRSIAKASFAERCGHSAKMISEIIAGKAPIEPETAIEFERVLGTPATYWLNLETLYRLRIAEQQERERHAKAQLWAKRFPLAAMVRLGHIEKPSDSTDAVRKLLNYFAVASVEIWESLLVQQHVEVAYRKSRSFESAPESVAAWLRRGETIAENRQCGPFDACAFKRVLTEVRPLTREKPSVFQPKLITMCAEVGVVVAFTPELPKTCLSGATRWLSKDKALIQLSLRHKTDDHLWFTFFHEAGHVLLHPKKLIIDEPVKRNAVLDPETARREQEANEYAAAALIPRDEWQTFIRAANFSAGRIRDFAKRLEIAPGIVMGQLQHNNLVPYPTPLNSLKVHFEWAEKTARPSPPSDK